MRRAKLNLTFFITIKVFYSSQRWKKREQLTIKSNPWHLHEHHVYDFARFTHLRCFVKNQVCWLFPPLIEQPGLAHKSASKM